MSTKREEADAVYMKYLNEGLEMFPPLKGYGIKLLQFAMEEPELYDECFLQKGELPLEEYIVECYHSDIIIPVICESLEISSEDAMILMKTLALFMNGMVVMLRKQCNKITMNEISTEMGMLCRGMLMHLKAPKDDRISMMPEVEPVGQDHGSLEEYIKGKKNVIIGYGQEKEMYQIRLDAILYFEAVGENVFAYTRNNVYAIKQRLYQVEENITAFSFVRASKSLIVNTKKIASMVPDTGGRGKINMINGETVVASRSYYKTVLENLKGTVG